jgi:hypothetical protein
MKAKESDLCKLFIRQVKQLKAWNYYKKDFEIIHIPNERITGKDSQNFTRHLYAMGMLPGVADYLVVYEDGRCAAIEFKRDKSGLKLKGNQLAFKARCNDLSLPYLVTCDVDEALEFLKSLLK